MTRPESQSELVEGLLASPDLVEALGNDEFKRLLDRVPIAVLVAEPKSAGERIVYANLAFETLSGRSPASVEGKPWAALDRHRHESDPDLPLGRATLETEDYIGTFRLEREAGEAVLVDAYASLIEDEAGAALFRLLALVDVTRRERSRREDLEQRLRAKDTLLKELQHRVKNNLQIVTALIRLEARGLGDAAERKPFDRLAGRIEALRMLYEALEAGDAKDGAGGEIDLGTYLSRIASAVMGSHAVEGIRLDLMLDAFPVSVNVAMPVGLVVNEVMTNALKHAFAGREAGTITLRCLKDDRGWRVVVADNGVGLPAGLAWPTPGKLGSLIVQSLRENAKADLAVESDAGRGTRVTMRFDHPAEEAGADD